MPTYTYIWTEWSRYFGGRNDGDGEPSRLKYPPRIKYRFRNDGYWNIDCRGFGNVPIKTGT